MINAAGPVTPLGAACVSQEVAQVVAGILRQPADLAGLQRDAAAAIRKAFGAEDGCVTGSTAASIAIAVAATLAGEDRGRAEALPAVDGLARTRVILQREHDCWFGARVSQMVRLAGATVAWLEGGAADAEGRLAAMLAEGQAAAALYVSSHHVTAPRSLPLEAVLRACRAAGVPVIVDAAGSVDLSGFLRAGADLVLGSAHKNFGAPTAGIVAGRAALVAACRMQEFGIGRAMKVGKEGIAGVIAALSAWQPGRQEAAWLAAARALCEALSGIPGLEASLAFDPPENRIARARVTVRAEAGGEARARALVEALKAGSPPVRVWEPGLPEGYFELDPRCLQEGEIETIGATIRALQCKRS